MAYTVYSNNIEKNWAGLNIFNRWFRKKRNGYGRHTDALPYAFRFFCGPIDLNGATERDLRTRIGHVLYLNGTEKRKRKAYGDTSVFFAVPLK